MICKGSRNVTFKNIHMKPSTYTKVLEDIVFVKNYSYYHSYSIWNKCYPYVYNISNISIGINPFYRWIEVYYGFTSTVCFYESG